MTAATLGEVLEAVEDELASHRLYDHAKTIRGWLETLEEADGGLPPAILNRPAPGVPVAAALNPGEVLLLADEVTALGRLVAALEVGATFAGDADGDRIRADITLIEHALTTVTTSPEE